MKTIEVDADAAFKLVRKLVAQGKQVTIKHILTNDREHPGYYEIVSQTDEVPYIW